MLFLGSKSASRQKLLHEAKIPFKTIAQHADESACNWNVSLSKLVTDIALLKMDHVILPKTSDQESVIYVLTADTMGQDKNGNIHGKPIDKQDAIEKIRALRGGGYLGTAFCLDRKIFKNNSWQIQDRIINYVDAHYIFEIPDNWIEQYLESVPYYLDISGAITIEGYGAQFLKMVDGSYSSILGLPMFELRVALEKMGFYKSIN